MKPANFPFMKIILWIFCCFLATSTGAQGIKRLRQENTDLKRENQQGNCQRFEDSLNLIHKRIQPLFQCGENKARVVTLPNKHVYHCYTVDTRNSNLQFFWKDKQGKPIKSLGNLVRQTSEEGKTLVFGTNAGMYKPNNSPQGLYIQDSKLLTPLDKQKSGYGNFYLQPNGVFYVDTARQVHVVKTQDFDDKAAGSAMFATQSGPMVVIDGVINDKFKEKSDNLHIRSGVGIIDKNHAVFVISSIPVNFYEFATVFLDQFKCKNALYLDGAISEMYLPQLFRWDDGGDFGAMIGIIKK